MVLFYVQNNVDKLDSHWNFQEIPKTDIFLKHSNFPKITWNFCCMLRYAYYCLTSCMNSWSSFESNPPHSLIICVTSIFLIWAQEIKNFDLLSEQFLIGYWPSNLTVIGGDLVSTAKKILAVEVFKKCHSQNKFLAVEVFWSRHSQKKLLAVEVFWVTKKWLWKKWNLILAVESVRTGFSEVFRKNFFSASRCYHVLISFYTPTFSILGLLFVDFIILFPMKFFIGRSMSDRLEKIGKMILYQKLTKKIDFNRVLRLRKFTQIK